MGSTRTIPENAALILIDVQQGFDDPSWGKRNNHTAEKNMARLLQEWRLKKRPLFHVKNDSTEPQSPLRPDMPGNRIKAIVKPQAKEPLITKTVNSALIGTDLESRLRRRSIKTLIIVGLTTDHCVSTTARMAANLGFEVYVVSDATATFERRGLRGGKGYSAANMHEAALVSLQDEFARIVDTDFLLDMRTA